MYRFPLWWIPIVVIVIAVPLGVWQFIALSPQTTLCMASGREGGAYNRFARKYIDALDKEGITVEECRTAGSVQNLKHLADPTDRSDSGHCGCNPDVALVQGGVASAMFEKEPKNLQTLMTTFHELVWVFYRTNVDVRSDVTRAQESPDERRQEKQWPPQELSDLAGLRIGIGEDGSGTRPLAELMLREVGLFLDEQNTKVVDCDANEKSKPQAGHTRLVGCSNKRAKDQLVDGKLDAAFFVVYPDDKTFFKELLEHEHIDFMSFRRAKAYASLFPYLVVVSLPEGVLNMVKNIPEDERTMLAVPANLVGSAKLPDDLVRALIRIITRKNKMDRKQDTRFAVFPWSPEDTVPTYSDLPVSDAARDWFEHGDSWLEREFENYGDRANLERILTVIPFILIFGVALAAIFPLRRRAIHGRFYHWYTVLREVEGEIESLRDEPSIEAVVQRINDVEREIASKANVPDWALGELYDLRVHIRLVLSRLEEQRMTMSESGRTK